MSRRERRSTYIDAEIRAARTHAQREAPRPRACDWDTWGGWVRTSLHRKVSAREAAAERKGGAS